MYYQLDAQSGTLCLDAGDHLVTQGLDVGIDYELGINLIDSESAGLEDEKNVRIKIDRSFQKAYEQAITDYTSDLKRFCNSRGAAFVTFCTDEPIERALFKELLKVGIMA